MAALPPRERERERVLDAGRALELVWRGMDMNDNTAMEMSDDRNLKTKGIPVITEDAFHTVFVFHSVSEGFLFT